MGVSVLWPKCTYQYHVPLDVVIEYVHDGQVSTFDPAVGVDVRIPFNEVVRGSNTFLYMNVRTLAERPFSTYGLCAS